MELSKKVANNILDFLIDPTKVPVKERVYFRPEEMLKNETYEKAKADAHAAFKDQKNNSDFYPHNKKSNLTQEANIMDRKSLIASLDVLSRNFKDASDPIAADLQHMAIALSKMDDETLQARLASDGPDLETVLSAATFKCPTCGTKVLEQTKYCVKCKKKVMPKTADDEAGETPEEEAKEHAKEKEAVGFLDDKEAMLLPEPRDFGQRFPGSSANPSGKIKSDADISATFRAHKDEIQKSPKLKGIFDKLLGKTAAEVVEEEEKEAANVMEIGQTGKPGIGERFPGSSARPGGPKIKSLYDEFQPEIKKTPWLKELFEGLMGGPGKTAEDFWTKEASAVIARALVADIIGVKASDDDDEGDDITDDTPDSKAKKAEEEETPAAEPKVEKVEEEKEEPKEAKATPKEEEKVEPPVEAKVVNTEVLASYNFAGIEVPVNFVDEAGEMSADEKANLARLF